MIINKLNVLLAERYIRASKLAKDTGIAQSTISKIVNNSTSQIDYSTLNTICNYLKITPGEFFEYSPWNLKITELKKLFDEEKYKFQIEVINDFMVIEVMNFWVIISNDFGENNITATIISDEVSNLGPEASAGLIFDINKDLSRGLKAVFSDNLEEHVLKQLTTDYPNHQISVQIIDF
ncbi:helix-turn-helix domain-containing protein [Lactococcus formosensis]|jgi:DNA-binding Xre family transcriptional regulator|uniref:Helix-turn-helix transcriptional regulator n=1 Tax=Lactococcus formosensis TaxID=1281486 RepID=A0A9Q9D6P9_9LACT|nr:helix-turn-helix transcriptional regulator [Lactococcus formosensis]USJ20212.1 helix-turn-helix transcriptional regulator [Lactococcus formosensis]